MALSEQDCERIDLRVERAVNQAAEKILGIVRDEMIAEHVAACPHGQRLGKSTWFVAGVGLGLFGLGTGMGVWIARLVR